MDPPKKMSKKSTAGHTKHFKQMIRSYWKIIKLLWEHTYLLGGSSHLVSGLVHPSYKWDFGRVFIHFFYWGELTYPLTIRGMSHHVPARKNVWESFDCHSLWKPKKSNLAMENPIENLWIKTSIYPTWVWLTVCHGKWPIEVDGLPVYLLKIDGFSMANC